MDFLFTQKKTYSFNEPMKNIVDDVLDIIHENNWAINLTGTFDFDKNSFKVARIWSFMGSKTMGILGGGEGLRGKITQEGNKTVIRTTSRPNIGLVLMFYILAILFLCELLGIKTMLEGTRIQITLFLLFFDALLFAIMFVTTNRLRATFEKELLRRRVRQDIAVGGFHLNADNDKNMQ